MSIYCSTFYCTSTHTSCYAAARSLALPHIRHATLLHVRLRFHTNVMLGCCTFACTSTHTSCYAAACSLALPHIRHARLLHVLLHFRTDVMLRCCTFFALPHMRQATLLDVPLHFHTYVMLCCWTFFCTSTHTSSWTGSDAIRMPLTQTTTWSISAVLELVKEEPKRLWLHLLSWKFSLALANLLKIAFVRSWLPAYSNAFEPKQLAMLMVAKFGKGASK